MSKELKEGAIFLLILWSVVVNFMLFKHSKYIGTLQDASITFLEAEKERKCQQIFKEGE